MQYRSDDAGESRHLKKLSAPREMTLKRGVPVMLLRNISSVLVNGSLGRVVDFTEEGPVVHFEDTAITMTIPAMKFTGTLHWQYIIWDNGDN